MIQYEGVTKVFGTGPNAVTAVDEVTFTVEKGDLVTLLGPSGCGKTTLLRLTNRLIAITRGSILINGEDIQAKDPVDLRKSMGYAIQAVGLFPNKTIYGNIATVPKLLGWEADRIRDRAQELLTMLQMAPEEFLERYPAELSGGQQQRVGVARCLAADPEILLMDEPFGAIDPINREEIQNEFLRVQAKLKKTIVFVTHDIHEALKMGDKIAIFQEGKLVQYDTPQTILTQPRNRYIKDFVGADRALKVLGLLQVKDTMRRDPGNVIKSSMSAREALKFLKKNDFQQGIVVHENQLLGYVTRDRLRQDAPSIKELAEPEPGSVGPRESLRDVMSVMLMKDASEMCVVDESEKFQGLIAMEDIQRSIVGVYSAKDRGDQ